MIINSPMRHSLSYKYIRRNKTFFLQFLIIYLSINNYTTDQRKRAKYIFFSLFCFFLELYCLKFLTLEIHFKFALHFDERLQVFFCSTSFCYVKCVFQEIEFSLSPPSLVGSLSMLKRNYPFPRILGYFDQMKFF